MCSCFVVLILFDFALFCFGLIRVGCFVALGDWLWVRFRLVLAIWVCVLVFRLLFLGIVLLTYLGLCLC